MAISGNEINNNENSENGENGEWRCSRSPIGMA
jgi:hypothetical protein